MDLPARKQLLWALLAGATLLWLYTLYRAAALSITYDEAWSWNTYVRGGWDAILTSTPPAANNHLLNSILMKLSSGLFGDGEFALRLPNVLAHLAYLGFSMALAWRFKKTALVIFGFVFLNLNPYLLDFFSLARGYGLAMAAMMGAIYFMYRFFDRKEVRALYFSILAGCLAVLANFTMLHVLVALVAVLGLGILGMEDRWRMLKRTLPALLMVVVLALIVQPHISKLIAANELYHGGKTGFWKDTVNSVAYSYLYKHDYWRYDMMALVQFVGLCLLVMFAAFSFRIQAVRFQLHKAGGVAVFLLLILPALSSTFQHVFLGSNFLLDRTGMFFQPLFWLAMVFLGAELLDASTFRRVTHGIGIALFVLLGLHSTTVLNLHHVTEWRYDACTTDMLEDLEALHQSDGNPEPVKLGISWQFRAALNYYITSHNLDWIEKIVKPGCKGDYDYYYVWKDGKGCKMGKAGIPFFEKQKKEVLKVYDLCSGKLGR
ncbi:MAG: glycosyltransferase family 39 protein [Bacteroidota bacterium]